MPSRSRRIARTTRFARITAFLAALAVVGSSIAATGAPTVLAADRGAAGGTLGAGTTDPTDPADRILVRYAPDTTEAARRALAAEQGLTRLGVGADGRTEVVVGSGRSTTTIERLLSEDPRVEAVAADRQRELADDVSTEPLFDDQWGLHNHGQTVGQAGITGTADVDIDGLQALAAGLGDPGVVVAVIDDGVDFSHPDLASTAWTNPGEAGALAGNGIDDDGNGYIDDVHGWDFCNDDASVHDAGRDGHGTHVAGTIAASRNGQGVVGVAAGVKIMALKFIEKGGSCGWDRMAVEAIDYAASFGVSIINASWGGPAPSSVMDAAIADSDALFVAAAGNWGADLDAGTSFYPASSKLPNVLAVAAIDQTGKLASFSNYGATTVDLVAPGKDILSTYPTIGCTAPCYAWASGTSMAAPHVSGVAALVAGHEPAMRDDAISLRGRLLATGRAIAAAAGTTSTGRLLNAVKAVDRAGPKVRAADRVDIVTNRAIGARSVSARVSWPAASDPLTGVVGYALRRGTSDGWTDVPTSGVTTKATTSLRFGAAHTYRLRATDGAGNVGGPADSAAFTPTLYGETSALATYGSGWSASSATSATGGRLRTSYQAGASMSITFTGRTIALVAPTGRSRGVFRVIVDGSYAKTVDLGASSSKAQVVVFSRSWTTSAAHTVRVEVIGTPGRARVDIDGFVIVR